MDELGRYLGAYMYKQGDNRRKFQYLIDKMQGQLCSWKKQQLSLARRITLVQYATNQLEEYEMQHAYIPTGIRQELKRMQRNFLWKSEKEAQKLHAVSWDTLCKEKRNGGLGLRDLGVMNDALLGRVAWNLIAKPDSLCSKVLSGKYSRGRKSVEECSMRKYDLKIWKNLCRIWPKITSNMYWEMGNGAKVRFWHDMWLNGGIPLAEHSTIIIPEEEEDIRVRELLNEEGGWDLQRINSWVNEEGRKLIMAIPPPNDLNGMDMIKWGKRVQNQYNVADMYHSIREEQHQGKRYET